MKASRHTLFEVKQEAGDGLAVRVLAVYNHENHTLQPRNTVNACNPRSRVGRETGGWLGLAGF